MSRAIELARSGWGQTAPNPLVGAVVCSRDGDVVGEGYHTALGEPHAEVAALQAAGALARGGTLYVNLEPCNHHGRTPPCTDAIIGAGIARVVASIKDPNPDASGGTERLRAAGMEVAFGALENEARELNAAFFHSFTYERPFVTLKLAISLDGAISDAKRTRRWLTNEQSRMEVQRIRAGNDAIAVGIKTAIADDPELTARTHPPPRVQPVRVVFDRNARLQPDSILGRTASDSPVVIVTARNVLLPVTLANAGIEAIAANDLDHALHQLRARGIKSMVVEGGAGLAASFLAAGCVDRLVIFHAPLILGDGSLGAFSGIASQDIANEPQFALIRTQAIGNDVMTVYAANRDSSGGGNPHSVEAR